VVRSCRRLELRPVVADAEVASRVAVRLQPVLREPERAIQPVLAPPLQRQRPAAVAERVADVAAAGADAAVELAPEPRHRRQDRRNSASASADSRVCC
jgi:hypothetical protein